MFLNALKNHGGFNVYFQRLSASGKFQDGKIYNAVTGAGGTGVGQGEGGAGGGFYNKGRGAGDHGGGLGRIVDSVGQMRRAVVGGGDLHIAGV